MHPAQGGRTRPTGSDSRVVRHQLKSGVVIDSEKACRVNEEIKLLRAIHGSARANGGETFGRVTFRLNKSPEPRWRELFDAGKGQGTAAEERGAEFLLHVEVKPGEVASKRDALLALITDVNDKRRAEIAQQAEQARERTDNKRNIEDALNRELEALKFE